ncbi:FAD:protein FMN transferase [Pseudomaricurvus alkylphenolicus]|uniref:FAD:protein FMN transferase n=1 Tax=Pseudomaricurvus alkylphenolicus TaxID=1306991 RepID=UPI00141F69E6|nr:FAD:protein FMN transferase [Pseudomaricurvus alkylphenolicus]NIB41269.1 FAD:protein FMN transferase [Pseudomaricurvus alkylphenolicus]
MTRSAMLASFWFCLWAFALSACSPRPELVQTRLSGATMGTSYNISIVAERAPKDVEALQRDIDALLQDINQAMSTYIPDSELNRLNGVETGQWQAVSAPLMEVLAISESVSQLSKGAFDVTLRPLIDLWGFGPDPAKDRVPSDGEIAAASVNVGYQNLELNQGRVRRHKPINVDLSAVAKGYGVDRVAQLLEAGGYHNYLVEIGGEIRLKGVSRRGTPWRIAVETPSAGLTQTVQRAIELSDMAMATSGDYRNYFERNGVRYSHTIDPRTGRPITHHLASVTVLDKSAARADALATAFSVLGLEQALPLANGEGIPALFIIRQGATFEEVASDTFKPYLANGP